MRLGHRDPRNKVRPSVRPNQCNATQCPLDVVANIASEFNSTIPIVVFVSSSFRNCTATSAHGFVEILRPVEPLGFAEPRHVAQYRAAEIRLGKVRAGHVRAGQIGSS